MAKKDYKQEAQALSEAIDIAIESFKKFPPNGADSNQTNHFISVYLEWKKKYRSP